MRPLYLPSLSRFADSMKSLAGNVFRRVVQRRVVCSVVALNLLMWPGPGLLAQDLLTVAAQALNSLDNRIGSRSYEAFFIGKLFSRTAAILQHETMASRAATVRTISLNPAKYVGYVDETITLTALPADLLDRTVPGIKFS